MAPTYVGATVNPSESPLDKDEFRGVSPEYQNYANKTDAPGENVAPDEDEAEDKKDTVMTPVGTLPNKKGPFTTTTETPTAGEEADKAAAKVEAREQAEKDAADAEAEKDAGDSGDSSTTPAAPAAPAVPAK